ncbi:MAG TPA: cytochrome c oxidase subunit II [Steroidobacteraceae bacterium]|nr:cytochrome c oxidase subunit II [Steroidobacteraceae bacterium]
MYRARVGLRPGTWLSIAALLAAAGTASSAGAANAAVSGWSLLNLPVGVTSISRDVYSIHMMAFWVSVVIGILVFGVMIWSIIFHRRSRGAVADVTLVHNTKVEIIWTTIPVLILVGMAIPAAHGLVLINDDAHSQLDIKVTGFQWGWQYTYPGKGVSFISKLDAKSLAASELDSGISPYSVPHYLRSVDHPLVVPVGTKVRLLIGAVDVIHSWWVPDLGVKKDAIPGYINTLWFEVDADKPGVYRGQCAELCGRGHGYMPIVVDAVSQADFQAWLKREAAAEKAAAGGAASS